MKRTFLCSFATVQSRTPANGGAEYRRRDLEDRRSIEALSHHRNLSNLSNARHKCSTTQTDLINATCHGCHPSARNANSPWALYKPLLLSTREPVANKIVINILTHIPNYSSNRPIALPTPVRPTSACSILSGASAACASLGSTALV